MKTIVSAVLLAALAIAPAVGHAQGSSQSQRQKAIHDGRNMTQFFLTLEACQMDHAGTFGSLTRTGRIAYFYVGDCELGTDGRYFYEALVI